MASMKRLTLRLSDNLHAELKQISAQENRSLHGEIIHRLKRALEQKNSSNPKKEFHNVK